jgi:hypothetical protein
VIAGDLQRSGPLAGIIQHLRRFAQCPSLHNLLSENHTRNKSGPTRNRKRKHHNPPPAKPHIESPPWYRNDQYYPRRNRIDPGQIRFFRTPRPSASS